MLNESSQKVYEKGVKLAESTEFRVIRAVSVYCKELGDNLDRPEMKARRRQIRSNVATQYWAEMECVVASLLEVAVAPEGLGLNSEWHNTRWGQAVWRAARLSYEHACPHETPRQLRAYALGLRALFTAPAEPGRGEKETEKEVEA
jgi:hypothetical protein